LIGKTKKPGLNGVRLSYPSIPATEDVVFTARLNSCPRFHVRFRGAAENQIQVKAFALKEGILMLEFLSYTLARVIAGVLTALILAMIFNNQYPKAAQFSGAATAAV